MVICGGDSAKVSLAAGVEDSGTAWAKMGETAVKRRTAVNIKREIRLRVIRVAGCKWQVAGDHLPLLPATCYPPLSTLQQ
jgi:hypothetical protein